MPTRYSLLLLIINPVLYLGMLLVNFLAVTLPINGKSTGELSDQYPNLFVPDGLTFSIWGIIYLLVFIFIFTPLFKRIQHKNTTSPSFAIQLLTASTCILNMSWIICWHYQYVLASILIMSVFLVNLIFLYKLTKQEQTPATSRFTTLPVSVYLGWITVATIANITAGLVYWNWNRWGLSEQTWTIIMISIATLITLFMVLKHNDWGFGLVIIWALWGIIRKRTVAVPAFPDIVYTAGISIAIILLLIGIKLFISFRKTPS